MSGVRTGSRLDQLQHLARRVHHEHAAAQRRDDTTDTARLAQLRDRLAVEIRTEQRARPEVATAVRAADDTVTRHLAALGVTARDVKQWAVNQGLIPAVVRGRVSGRLVDAYATAHQPQETT